MKAKLIKVGDHYDLYYRDEVEDLIIGFASTDGTFERKLSVKKCKSIEKQLPNQRMWDVNVETEGPEVDDEGIYCGLNIKKDEDGYLILKMYETT